jgi:hypothetical protein
MDSDLKLLADASLHVGAAEDALGECAFVTAGERLDEAATALAELRERWPAMTAAERAVVTPAARDVRARLDEARRRVPRIAAVSEGAPERDPEEDVEPEAA